MEAEELKDQTEATELHYTVNSIGWGILMERAENIITELMDIRSLPDDLTPENKIKEIEKREAGVSLFQDLLRQIVGDAAKIDFERKKEKDITEHIIVIKDQECLGVPTEVGIPEPLSRWFYLIIQAT